MVSLVCTAKPSRLHALSYSCFIWAPSRASDGGLPSSAPPTPSLRVLAGAVGAGELVGPLPGLLNIVEMRSFSRSALSGRQSKNFGRGDLSVGEVVVSLGDCRLQAARTSAAPFHDPWDFPPKGELMLRQAGTSGAHQRGDETGIGDFASETIFGGDTG